MATYALVVGDIIVDRRLSGTFSAASVDAGYPCIDEAMETVSLGGAAGIAANMQSLQHQTRLIGTCGNDAAKALLLKVLADASVTCRLFEVDGERTHIRERTTVSDHTLISHDMGGNYTKEEAVLQAAMLCLQPAQGHSEVNLLVLADFGRGTLTRGMVQTLIGLAAGANIPVLATTATASHIEWYQGVTVLQTNGQSAIYYLHDNVHPGLVQPDPAGRAAVAAQQIQFGNRVWGVVVTRGAAGFVTFTQTGGQCVTAALSTHCNGDVLTAALAVRLIEGFGLDGEFAARATDVAAKTALAASVRRVDVEAASPNIHVPMQEALAYRRHLNTAGKTCALVVDTFDPLHAGHIDLLLAAKDYADTLFVAYADDAAAQAATGPGRQSIPAVTRARQLSAIRGISRVFEAQGDATAIARMFHPDVYVVREELLLRGPIPAADYVASYGGRVEFVKRSEN